MAIMCCSFPRSTIYTPLTLLSTWSRVIGLVSSNISVEIELIATGTSVLLTALSLAVTTNSSNALGRGDNDILTLVLLFIAIFFGSYPIKEINNESVLFLTGKPNVPSGREIALVWLFMAMILTPSKGFWLWASFTTPVTLL